jgi:hypothetical protein
MSRIKQLKSESENIINIIDMLSIVCPVNKTKYVETLNRIMKKTKHLDEYTKEMKSVIGKKFGKTEELNKFTDIQFIFFFKFLDTMFRDEDLDNFVKFCDLYEKNLIEKKDLTKYSSFNEIADQVTIAEMKVIEKEMESQIVKLHQDSEWVVLRPLTYEASKKYGSNTKWCTTSEKEPGYFLKYSKSGILIYVINKKTGLKVGCFRSILDNEFSFWNQKDERIDSLQSGLPDFIINVIKSEIENRFIPNSSLGGEISLNDEKKIKSEDNPYRSITVDFNVGRIEPEPQYADIPQEEPTVMEEEEPSQEIEENVLGRELVRTYGITRDINEIENMLTETIARQLEIPFPNTNNRA